MLITSIWAENWKSFGPRQEIPLSQLTLLIGPNNAGKSNALGILTELKIAMGSPGSAAERFARHRFYASSETAKGSLGLGFSDEDLTGAFRAEYQASSQFASTSLDCRAAPEIHQRISLALSKLLSSYEVWRAQPQQLRGAHAVTAQVKLGLNGQGAPAVLDHLRDSYTDRYEALGADFRRCAPEIQSVVASASANTGEGKKMLFFHERTGAKIPAGEASDGLLFLLFVLLILHSPDPPGILAIEEIEHGVHPRRQKDLVGFLRRLAETPNRPQIICTTHSPYVLDEFRDTPEQVVVIERNEQNATVCTRLTDRLSQLKDKGAGTALGDLWYSGVLGGVPNP